MVLMPVVRLNLEKPRSALALINLKFFGSVLLDLRPNVEIKGPISKGCKFFFRNGRRQPKNILLHCANLGEMPEWSNGPVSKSGVCHRTEGSNPSLSLKQKAEP